MSESNAPFNHPGQSESADTAVDWENPFADLADSIHSQDERSLEDLFFEAELNASPAEESTAAPTPKVVTDPIAAIAAWSESAATEPAEVDVTDLISLIQELNQCNSILLDRVSQLEEALEHSQVALQAEVGRSQDGATEPPTELTASPEAIVSLFNQLEFAHQANQRQQILIETLTGQLESSQERVAELERESALVQQRYSEQIQLLGQTESSNRDLQARLHRQQRYTLQFKAALEKCLEVPTPQYDLGAEAMTEAIMGDNPFLLKTQKIQPWSAQADSTAHPWMKLGGLIEKLNELSELEESAGATAETSIPSLALPTPEGLPSLKLADFSTGLEPDVSISDASMQQVMEILPDLLAIERNIEPNEAIATSIAESTPPQACLSAPQDELRSEATAQPAVESLPESRVQDLAEGEDALWQDLARLIEVSTEDMVRASLSGDSPIPLQSSPEANPPELEPFVHASHDAPLDSAAKPEFVSEDAAETEDPGSFIPALSQPSWPSPVVYPLRSTKKQRSSGVDLPSFLRPGTDPLPT
jgi:hypothetical protein